MNPRRLSSGIASWNVDQEFMLTEFNQAFSQRFQTYSGKTPQLSESVLALISDSQFTPQYQDWEKWYQRCLDGENFSVITEWPHANSDSLEEVYFQTIYDEFEIVQGVSCFSREVSAEELALEDQVQEIEKRYRTLTIHSRDILAMHSLDGTYEYINPVSEDIWGHKIESLLGQKPFAFIHPEDLQEFKRIFFLPLFIGNKYTPFAKSFRFKTNKTDYVWLEMLVTVLLDDEDQPYKLISSTRGLKNCFRDPDKVVFDEDQLDKLINSNEMMLAAVDLMGNFSYCSKRFHGYYLEQESIEINAGNQLNQFSQFKGVWNQIEPVLYGEIPELLIEIPGVHASESQHFCVRPIKDKYGDTTGLSLLVSA